GQKLGKLLGCSNNLTGEGLWKIGRPDKSTLRRDIGCEKRGEGHKTDQKEFTTGMFPLVC
ncbi:MAG: hypothetical protein NWE80_05125, partial [Candidatus Bathyarchaeota archaeon]|nr:hypothetical protein [Candidatus Bathyarchaeota archaeon]